MWQLIINGPGYFDTLYDLPEGLTTLGRAEENDIVLSGDLVSRKHVRFMVTPDAIAVEDLGSRNGSRLNGEAFTGMRVLSPGDLVLVGENSLALRRPSEAEAAATEVLDLAGSQLKRLDEDAGFAPEVIVKRNVNRSVLLRALDNFGPFEPSPFEPETSAETAADLADLEGGLAGAGAGARAPPLSYDSLLLLFKVAESLARSRSLNDFLTDAVDRVLTRVGATTMVVLLRQPSGALSPSVVRHRGQLGRGEVPVSDAIISESLRSGAALAVAVRDDQRFASRESVILYGADQVLCIPVGNAAPFPGVLYLNRPGTERESLESLLDLLAAVAHLVAVAVEKFRSETASSERLRHALERFHPPAVVSRTLPELSGSPALEERVVTIVHAELTGANALSAQLAPERAARLLEELHRRMAPLVFSYHGSVIASRPPSLIGVFGAPDPQADDAIRAVRAAMAMRDAGQELCEAFEASDVALTIGVHTGRVLAGHLGHDGRAEFAVLGDPVQRAGWIAESAPNPGQVLVSGKTLASIGARFDVTPLGEREIHPKADKVPLFEVLGEDVSDQTDPGVN